MTLCEGYLILPIFILISQFDRVFDEPIAFLAGN
jgi:hypothetical protein